MDTSVTRPELLLVADAVSREKNIDREQVLEAMEQAIQKAGRAKYGHEKDIRATIDRKTGEVRLSRWTEAVEVVENEDAQIPLKIARKFRPEIQEGEFIVDPLPPIDFGRIAAQTAKQVIVQRVREYERKRQYDEFKDRVGEIINGTLKQTEYGNLMVELGGQAEGLLRRDEMIPREEFRNSDRIRAYIYDVRDEPRGPQIFLSRTHPGFLAKLFAQEVPEIYDGIIEIKAVARDPGSRAKMAVESRDASIDPVGACVGMRGSRVQAVVAELQGEKIDIIPWSPHAATFVVNALAPAEVTKVVMDEDAGRVEVVVPDEQLSLAIGRRGQNVRLASQLTRWDIDILTEAEESERRQEEFRKRTSQFVNELDVDDVIAGLLVTEGYHTIEDLAYADPAELHDIEGFDEAVAEELMNRANNYLASREQALDERRRELGVSDDLVNLGVFSLQVLVELGEKGIRTLDDLADLAADELIELLGGDE
ncbi:transcription termination factor NusA, partial [Bombella apis]